MYLCFSPPTVIHAALYLYLASLSFPQECPLIRTRQKMLEKLFMYFRNHRKILRGANKNHKFVIGSENLTVAVHVLPTCHD